MPKAGTEVRDWVREIDEIKNDIKTLERWKVDEKMMNLKFERITEDIQGVKSDIKGVKSDVKEINNKLSKKATIQLGSLVTLVVVVIGAAVFILKMDLQVGRNTESLDNLAGSVQEVGESNKGIKKDLQVIKLNGEKGKEERLKEIRDTFKDVLIEAKIDIKSKRKR